MIPRNIESIWLFITKCIKGGLMTPQTQIIIRTNALKMFFAKWDRLTDPSKENRRPGREKLSPGDEHGPKRPTT